MKNFTVLGIVVFIILATAFFVSTQYAAREFGYPHNGHYVEIDRTSGFKIYAPYQIIVWMYYNHMNKDLEGVFKVSTDIVFMGLFAAFAACFGIFLKKKAKKVNTYSQGDASWMTKKELLETGNYNGEGVVLCQSAEAKLQITDASKNSMRVKKPGGLITDDGATHDLIIAPTRGGKGVGTVIPTLCHWKHSVFCYDIKRENFMLTAGYRNLFSTVLKYDPAEKGSLRWNPLNEIRVGTINEVADAQMIAEILMNPDGDKQTSDIWFAFARKLSTGLILYLINNKAENQSITGMYQILSSDKTVVEKLKEIVEYDTGKTGINQIIRSYLFEFIEMANSEKQFAGAISSTLQSLELYLDPIVQENTSVSDFSLKDLMNSEYPVSLYYCVPPSAESRMRPLTRLMISCLFSVTTEKLDKPKHRLLMMIDEFPSLGKLEIVEKAMAYVAGYGIKVYLIIQSITQLNKIYTEKNSIVDNCHLQMFYATNRIEVAKEISERIGKTTILVDSVSTSGQRTELFDKGQSRSTQEVAKALLSPEDVMKLPYTDAILFISGKKPYLAKKNVFYDDPRFKEKVKMSPPTRFDLEYLQSYNENKENKNESGNESQKSVQPDQNQSSEPLRENHRPADRVDGEEGAVLMTGESEAPEIFGYEENPEESGLYAPSYEESYDENEVKSSEIDEAIKDVYREMIGKK